MTAKEIFHEMLKPDGKPERLLIQYEPFGFLWGDPVSAWMRGGSAPGKTVKDKWGVTIIYPEGAPGAMPHITPENKACPDITRWRDYCIAPDIKANCSEGWEATAAKRDEIKAAGKIPIFLFGTGLFEQLHYLMGFEDTLKNFYEHPDEMHELIDYILDFRISYLKLYFEKAKPEAVLSHDDWGTKDALFMHPDIWRAFFKEPYRKLYGFIRSEDVIAIHHADSYLSPIVEDMAEIGIQCWQGVLPENDIPELQSRLKGRMLLMGGIGAAIDRNDATEDEIRAHVENALEAYTPGGGFIPCLTYGGPWSIYPHIYPVIDDAISKYNETLHLPSFVKPVYRRATAAEPVKQTEAAADSAAEISLLDKLAAALMRGRRTQVLALTEEALTAGYEAETILTEGLLPGMTALGDDYSAGKVYAPEMLIAAGCMAKATAVLKPHLMKASGGSAGRACIGTVEGDLHDIGKNLVKIMLEGNGFEVIDLGTDVSAKTFIDTAINEHCDVIACSALLTTAMDSMRGVVDEAKTRGVRDDLIIMVGGAPVSETFCHEIGADIYTKDAASAGKAAAAAVRLKKGTI